MTLPNFFIIGAMKAGTTLLWDVLNQHPDTFMSQRKEPHYFSFLSEGFFALEGARAARMELSTYQALFADSGNALAIGEASTSYLRTPGVAEQIHQLIPAAKLICVLRNPVERAYSHYLWMVRLGIETESTFAAALAQEQSRIRQDSSYGRYLTTGQYHHQLQNYLHLFSREQIFICLLEDLTHKPAETYTQIYDFLGIDNTFVGDMGIRRNPSGRPKSRWLNDLISRPNPLRDFMQPRLPKWLYRQITHLRDANLVKSAVEIELQQRLIEYYRHDVEALQVLLGRDLTQWLRPS